MSSGYECRSVCMCESVSRLYFSPKRWRYFPHELNFLPPRPYPTQTAIEYLGHIGLVRCISVRDGGLWCARWGEGREGGLWCARWGDGREGVRGRLDRGWAWISRDGH